MSKRGRKPKSADRTELVRRELSSRPWKRSVPVQAPDEHGRVEFDLADDEETAALIRATEFSAKHEALIAGRGVPSDLRKALQRLLRLLDQYLDEFGAVIESASLRATDSP